MKEKEEKKKILSIFVIKRKEAWRKQGEKHFEISHDLLAARWVDGDCILERSFVKTL